MEGEEGDSGFNFTVKVLRSQVPILFPSLKRTDIFRPLKIAMVGNTKKVSFWGWQKGLFSGANLRTVSFGEGI